MIKNIILDLGGVLLDIDLIYCMQQVEALGIDLRAFQQQEASILSGKKAAVMGEGLVATGAMHLYQIGGISTENFLEEVRQHCRPGTTREEVLRAWNTCCIGIPQYRLDKIAQLRKKGYRTFMLSNTNDAHWQDIKERCFGGSDIVAQHFDQVFLSQEMHMAKPNDEIFLTMLKKIGERELKTEVKAEECLFIDDSTANVEAARELGFHVMKAEVSQTHEGRVIATPKKDWTKEIDKVLAF